MIHLMGPLLTLLLLSASLVHAAGDVVGLTCTIRWQPVAHPQLDSYRLRVSQVAGTYDKKIFAKVPAPDTEASCDDLVPPVAGDGQYYVVVSTFSKGGQESAYAPEVPFVRDSSTAPVASYTFNSTADASGHGHTVLLTGASALAKPGIIGGWKLQMPTIGDYAFAEAHPDFYLQQWGMAGWISMTQVDLHGCLWAGTGHQYGGLITPQGQPMCYLEGKLGRVEASSPPSVMVLGGRPAHLACNYDGETLETWVNGSRVGQVSSRQKLDYTGTEAFYIGKAPTMLGFGCLGSLDELLITPVPLTPAQIQLLAKGGKLP